MSQWHSVEYDAIWSCYPKRYYRQLRVKDDRCSESEIVRDCVSRLSWYKADGRRAIEYRDEDTESLLEVVGYRVPSMPACNLEASNANEERTRGV